MEHARAVPVVDAERERQVLDATVAQASELAIDAASVRRLFSLQIQLAVRVQESLISWRCPSFSDPTSPCAMAVMRASWRVRV